MLPNQCRSNFSDHVKKNSVGNSYRNISFCTGNGFQTWVWFPWIWLTFYLSETFWGEVEMIETESAKFILFIIYVPSRRKLNINTFIWRPKISFIVLIFCHFLHLFVAKMEWYFVLVYSANIAIYYTNVTLSQRLYSKENATKLLIAETIFTIKPNIQNIANVTTTVNKKFTYA